MLQCIAVTHHYALYTANDIMHNVTNTDNINYVQTIKISDYIIISDYIYVISFYCIKKYKYIFKKIKLGL